jgi:hypothetical protein
MAGRLPISIASMHIVRQQNHFGKSIDEGLSPDFREESEQLTNKDNFEEIVFEESEPSGVFRHYLDLGQLDAVLVLFSFRGITGST